MKRSPRRLLAEQIDGLIYTIRGHRVILDRDLAQIYGVSTRRLNEQIKRNRKRFPSDFVFRLSPLELENWMSQFAISNFKLKMGLRKIPLAFTEHGAVAASFILSSPIATESSVRIVRAFNRMRQGLVSEKKKAALLSALQGKVAIHDKDIQTLFAAINEIMEPPIPPAKRIGFTPKTDSR